MPLNPPDISELKAIVDWVNLTDDVRELSLKFGDVELFISRDRHGPATPARPVTSPVDAAAALPSAAVTTAMAPPTVGAAAAAPATVSTAPSASVASAEAPAANEVVITAPMVGTFYASPKPGDPAFVAVGDAVTATTVLGIVEVMKLMNNLEAKVDGTVARILVENEQAVQYGQPLMEITRDA